jgi:hypothetical protein
LLLRNPWLLGGMGVLAAIIVTILKLIPVVGGLLIALLAPLLLASAYLAIDGVAKQKMALPARLRSVAVKQSARELFSVFGAERRLVPAVFSSILTVAAALLISLVIEFSVGAAWSKPWTSLGVVSLLSVLVLAMFALVAYATLAAALIYALPLAFLQNEALFPAIERSLRTCRDNVAALTALLAFALVPMVLGTLASFASIWVAAMVWLIGAAGVLPLTATSLYCSYRTLFTIKESVPPARPSAAPGGPALAPDAAHKPLAPARDDH